MIVALIDEGDLHKWTITMDGPPGSPYAVCGEYFQNCCHSQIERYVLSPPKGVPEHPRPTSYLAREFVSKILRVRCNAQHLMILPKVFDYLS
jgi:hypothetical protein